MTSLFLLFFDPQTGSFFSAGSHCLGVSVQARRWRVCRLADPSVERTAEFLHIFSNWSLNIYINTGLYIYTSIYIYIYLYMHVCTYIYLYIYIYILRSTRHFRLWRSLTCIASVCIQPMTSCGITSCARCPCCWCSHIGAGLQRKGNAGCVGFQLLTVAIVVVGGLTLV